MRPGPIPDRDLAHGGQRRTFGAPAGHEDTIRPVEVLCRDGDPAPTYSMRIELEDGDLERLADQGHLWLTMWGAVVPFTFDVDPT